MIDFRARKQLLEDRLNKGFQRELNSELGTKLDQLNAKTEKSINIEFETINKLGKISRAIVMLYDLMKKPLPDIFNIKGSVEVTKQPPVTIDNLSDLADSFASLEDAVRKISFAISSMPPAEVNMPEIRIPEIIIPKIEVPKVQVTVPEIKIPEIKVPPASQQPIPPELLATMKRMLVELESIRKSTLQKSSNSSPDFNGLIEKIDELISQKPVVPEFPSMKRTETLLESFVNRPVMTPQPVTNININGLQGFAKTTAVTLGTTRTRLPSYGQLFNRRTLMIYNNGANTIYIGGSDVTSTNGLPILGNSYSPPIDAGYNMIIYGIATTSGNDIRVIEVSKDQTSNIQE